MNQPSAWIPETPERRVEISQKIAEQTGLNNTVLNRMVRAFYDAARTDTLIGPLFDHVTDWETHIHTITMFWSSVTLLTKEYDGRPLPPHLKLDLQPAHFERWLQIFERTVRAECSPAGADLLLDRARRIARSFEMATEVHRGQLPPSA